MPHHATSSSSWLPLPPLSMLARHPIAALFCLTFQILLVVYCKYCFFFFFGCCCYNFITVVAHFSLCAHWNLSINQTISSEFSYKSISLQFIVVIVYLFMFARQRHTPFILHAFILPSALTRVYQYLRCCPSWQRPFDLGTVGCSTLTVVSWACRLLDASAEIYGWPQFCINASKCGTYRQHLHICCKIFIPPRTQ